MPIIYRSGLGRNLTPDEVDNNFLYLAQQIQALQGGGGNPGATQLATPTGFATTPLNSSQIGTSWNQVSNNSGYQVRYATDSAFTQNVFTAQVSANTTSATLVGLSAATTYYAQVQALGNGTTYSTSGYSTPAQAATQAGGGTVSANRIPFLSKGQSNEEGAEKKAALFTEQLAAYNLTSQAPNTNIYHRENKTLAPLQFGVNHFGGTPLFGVAPDAGFGAELGLAWAMKTYAPDKQLDIVRLGVGGRTVEQLGKNGETGTGAQSNGVPGNASPQTWYQQFVTAALELKAIYTAAGLAWNPVYKQNQGESGGSAADWPAKTKADWDNLTADGVLTPTSKIIVVIPQGSVEGNVAAMRANVLSLASLDSRVVYVDAAQYNLQPNDPYHYDGFSYFQQGSYDLYREIFGLSRNSPSYINAPQSYATTAQDYTAKCGSGTGSTVTKTRQAVSYASKTDSAAQAQALARDAAIAGIVCAATPPPSTTPAVSSPEFTGESPRVLIPATTGIKTLAFWFKGGPFSSATTPGLNNILLDNRMSDSETLLAYLDQQNGSVGLQAVHANGVLVSAPAGFGLNAIATGSWVKVVIDFSDQAAAANMTLSMLRRGVPFDGYYRGAQGFLADIFLYSRHWTEAELANATTTFPTDSVLAHYDFVGTTSSSTVLPDVSGNGRTASMIVNTP